MYKTSLEKRSEILIKMAFLLIAIFILLFIGAIVYHFSEGWSYLDSLYFSAISLTSRGFSDMRPTNWVSISFSIVYLFTGVAIIIYSVSTLVAYYSEYYEHKVKNAILNINKEKKDKWVVLKYHNKQKPPGE